MEPLEKAKTARLFFALWPDTILLDALAQAIRPLRKGTSARWIPQARWHITLQFLGAMPLDRMDELMSGAGRLLLAPADLTLAQVEHWKRQRVLCLTGTAPEPLQVLVSGLRGVVQSVGLEPENRPFRIHLTFARHVDGRPILPHIKPVVWPVREFSLVQSRLSMEGPEYTVLRSWPAAP